MLGVIPVSNTKAWLATFDLIEELKAAAPLALRHASDLMPGNARWTDMEIERE